MDDFESYINAIDVDYDSWDFIFSGCVYKLKSPQFNIVKRSAHAKDSNNMQEIVEYRGQNSYIPTSGYCFIKSNNYYTSKDYTEEFLNLIRTEQRKSNVMTTAGIQPFCWKTNINIGCFLGTRRNPRNITERNVALKIHNNQFCLIWNSQNNSFDQAIENELKPNFKFVDNVISDKHVKSYFNYEYKPKKAQSA